MGRGSDEVYRDLMGLQEKISRLFDEQSVCVRGDREAMHAQWTPAVDIYETNEGFVLAAEIPGVPQDEIHLEINRDLLIIRGERPSAMGEASHRYHRVERPNGLFQRAFRLPVVVDPAGVRATYRNGILTVGLPKQGVELGRAVSVKVEG